MEGEVRGGAVMVEVQGRIRDFMVRGRVRS